MPYPAKLGEDHHEQLWELYCKRTPQSALARHFGCSRTSVSNAVARIKKKLAEGRREELEHARAESIAVYQAAQAEAWRRLTKCPPASTAAVGYLAQIVESQRQQDRLLGLEEITVNHRGMLLARLEAVLDTPVSIVLPGSTESD
jgi:hypothetical protein